MLSRARTRLNRTPSPLGSRSALNGLIPSIEAAQPLAVQRLVALSEVVEDRVALRLAEGHQ
eukprot:11079751-Alexandrium_andersonii.AAC.1